MEFMKRKIIIIAVVVGILAVLTTNILLKSEMSAVREVQQTMEEQSEEELMPSMSEKQPEETMAPPVSEEQPEETMAPPVSEEQPEETMAPPVSEKQPEETMAPPVSEKQPEETMAPPVSEEQPKETMTPSVSEKQSEETQEHTCEYGHDFQKSIWETATCLKGGFYNNVCKRCGLVENVTEEPLPHDVEEVVVQDGNCMEDTIIRHMCRSCEQQIGSDTRYTVQTHNWIEGTVDDAAVIYCEWCGVVQ